MLPPSGLQLPIPATGNPLSNLPGGGVHSIGYGYGSTTLPFRGRAGSSVRSTAGCNACGCGRYTAGPSVPASTGSVLERMSQLLWPRVVIRHPWPDQRFAVNHLRQKPDGLPTTSGSARKVCSNAHSYGNRGTRLGNDLVYPAPHVAALEIVHPPNPSLQPTQPILHLCAELCNRAVVRNDLHARTRNCVTRWKKCAR